MRTSHLAPVVLVAVLAAAVAPALAAEDRTITASSDTFSPPEVSIAPGDRVMFANAGGSHNFVFEDGPAYPQYPTASGSPVWGTPLSRTFTAEGRYRFYCAAHGAPGGYGMSGVVVVDDPSTEPTPTPTPVPTTTPVPTPTPPPGGGDTPPGGERVRVRSFAAAAGSFCVRRGPECRRPGVRLRVDLSRPARVTGVLRRAGRRFGRVDFGTVAAGPRTLRFRRTAAGRRLAAGRYALAATVEGAGTRTVRFRVR